MYILPLTLVFSACYLLASAGTRTHGQSCSALESRLEIGTYQFHSDCDAQNYCSGQGICEPKGCRKDQYPFGYTQSDDLPPKCPTGQFCPDEGDACQPLLSVGSPCQLNRDDQCGPPPNWSELADTSHYGVNVNGSVCLNNVCVWANVTVGESCQVENTAYIVYAGAREFIDIVSRGNCHVGLYCDSKQLVCVESKPLGESCKCASFNCNSGGVCVRSPDIPNEFGVWVYALAGISIFGGMFGTLFALSWIHRRQRDVKREKRLQYWAGSRIPTSFGFSPALLNAWSHSGTTTTTTTARRMSTSLSPRPEAAILPSLPPSPSLLEEVFSHPRPWSVRHEEFDLQGSRRSSPGSAGSYTKGKGKQRLEEEDEDEEDDEDTQHRASTHESYPPMTDEAAETQRVEETLKRWELAERQRRRSARESAQHTSGPSLLSSVTRTAGLVLSGRTTSIGASIGPGGTRAFKSHETVDVAREGALTRSLPYSTAARAWMWAQGQASGKGTSENPFEHPSERTRPSTPILTPVSPTQTLPHSTPPLLSPFADAQAVQAEPTKRRSTEGKTHAHKRSSGSRLPTVPPPRPLGLPPPPEDIPHVTPLQSDTTTGFFGRRRAKTQKRDRRSGGGMTGCVDVARVPIGEAITRSYESV
ncbi:hypothetical protein J3R83DRAFT_4221 [Lanmaoa asiatica]|nr:hypothetical protein J3R83DRAFT_4221 [Lanmaoa asiatica]